MGSSRSVVTDSRPRRVVAVEIGVSAVHAAEIEIRGAEYRVLRQGRAAIPAQTWDNLAAERDRLSSAIRSAMGAAGIGSARVVTALPRRYVTVKYARLPQADPEQVAGMVRFEAQQYVPFPVDDAVIAHQIVSEPGDDLATVMIVASRRTLVNDLLAAFDKASLEISRISVSSLALAEHIRSETLPAAVFATDDGNLDMAVAGAGRLLFSRSVEYASGAALGAPAEVLGGELTRSLSAYQNEHRSMPVEKIVAARLAVVPEVTLGALEGVLQMPVHVLGGAAGSTDTDGSAVVAGLALHEASDALSQINLLPEERIQRRAVQRKRTVTRGVAILALIVLAGGAWSVERALAAQAKERTRAEYENRRWRNLEPVLKRTQDERDQLVRMHAAVVAGLDRGRPVVDVVKAISDALPKGGSVYLTQLTYERGGAVVLHGTAGGQEAATEFLLGLQASGAFAEARLGYLGDAQVEGKTTGAGLMTSRAAPGEKMSFMLVCRLPQTEASEDKPGRQVRSGRERQETSVEPVR